ncbi:hypothetical protein E2562_023171 [Oryza meyeriana var. granulata]|uniref:Uncharacterized protein n=1 Tax=Oryza meyeriana var. granulata TaxID=110450 RepID=A0A6G1BZK9_9ORYZ|nr:hypothetical protein E2562_023171 [Oryza meyeriana var. granulata]
MATGTGSESVCASTGASPAATPVGTGESAPNPQPPATLALKETSTVAGGGGAANVVIVEEETGEDGTCTPAHTSEENADIEEFLYEDEVNRGEATEEGSGEDHEDSNLDDMDGLDDEAKSGSGIGRKEYLRAVGMGTWRKVQTLLSL